MIFALNNGSFLESTADSYLSETARVVVSSDSLVAQRRRSYLFDGICVFTTPVGQRCVLESLGSTSYNEWSRPHGA